MDVVFTAHNIRLDNGLLTRPEEGMLLDQHPWFIAAKRILNTVFPGDKSHFRVADLGCLEGGYSVLFARMGFQVLGLEVRDSNMAACRYVQANTNLPNLEFVQNNAWNISRYGTFDATFCCGLLYHLDQPKRFLEILSAVTTKLLILQTHFSTDKRNRKFRLSELTKNESLQGRWFTEFGSDADFMDRDNKRWSAWDNRRSFWIRREYLLQAIQDVGFDLVMEQFDGLGQDITGSMLDGPYNKEERGTFIGIKSGI
jgi:2-polyprenyl-3-methyl-5-hydroxy-6-metoxy-1,4-benzoquinol methylase